ncbi:hypothetical protein [Streptomyces brevispora]|uniref:Acyl-CoA dehydrogenase C-terminal domain-containing protein n=1 Tax=Streptomyces brevispora TaxID=887462 RepID=A0ABZ1G7T3_9ACTN|nr:hypothetical protein [Streptomyces brevispora]WSC15968.1 hypothetical protein OIE64_26160 [Streptomyces brevispora]
MGRARPVEGGYVFNGRWPFSSGTDHCQWVMIGGLITDQIFKVSGGSQLHAKNPMQRMWRDCQSALHHVQNYAGPLYQAYGMNYFGGEMPAAVKV